MRNKIITTMVKNSYKPFKPKPKEVIKEVEKKVMEKIVSEPVEEKIEVADEKIDNVITSDNLSDTDSLKTLDKEQMEELDEDKTLKEIVKWLK